MLLSKGEVVNDTYEVRFFIGEGAFGEVYRVRHRFLGLQVLKIFKESYLDHADIETLTREAIILSQVLHPNIVRVFETNSFQRNGKEWFYLTMGFVSGESLGERLRRVGALDMRLALSIQTDVLKGLVEIQRRDLVHRDIYPNNVLLCYDDDEPRALLSDFGLALSLDRDFALSVGGGNYVYTAPECFMGVFLPASDVFSTGLILYQMLTGELPWQRNVTSWPTHSRDIASSVLRTRKGNPRPVSDLNPDVDKELESIIEKALALKLEDRFKHARQFLEALQSHGTD